MHSVMPSALEMLAADTLGLLAEDTGSGPLAGFWDFRQARYLAREFVHHLRGLSRIFRQTALHAGSDYWSVWTSHPRPVTDRR